jgi:hypothetical protein
LEFVSIFAESAALFVLLQYLPDSQLWRGLMCLFRLASVAWLGCNLFGVQLYAQDCTAVLTLSRESTSAIGSDQEVKSHAQNFCREHFSSQTTQKSAA